MCYKIPSTQAHPYQIAAKLRILRAKDPCERKDRIRRDAFMKKLKVEPIHQLKKKYGISSQLGRIMCKNKDETKRND